MSTQSTRAHIQSLAHTGTRTRTRQSNPVAARTCNIVTYVAASEPRALASQDCPICLRRTEPNANVHINNRHGLPALLPQTENGSTQSTAWEYPCFPRCEESESPVRVLRVRQCIRSGRGLGVARCRHGPDHHREPGHPPFAGTAEYPCEYSEYPMGVLGVLRVPTNEALDHHREPGHPPFAGTAEYP